MQNEHDEKNREARIRRLARHHGYALRKSRVRKHPHFNNRGEYLLLDPWHNRVVGGERFDLRLDDIEAFFHGR